MISRKRVAKKQTLRSETRQEDVHTAEARRTNGQRLLDFRKMVAIMRKNLTVILRDKTRLLPLLMFPVFMIVIFGYTTGTMPTHIPVAIIAYDHSPLSQQLQEAIAQNEAFAIRSVVSTESEGRKLLDSGEARVLIVIPADMQAIVDSGGQSAITVVVDESDSAIATTSRQVLASIITTFSDRLSEERISSLQRSVDRSAETLKSVALAHPEGYDEIEVHLSSASDSVFAASALLASDRQALQGVLPLPGLFVPSTLSEDEYVVSAETMTLIESPAYLSSQSQLGLLSRAEGMLSDAATQLGRAVKIAGKVADISVEQQRYQRKQELIEEPIRAIKVFTAYAPSDLLSPLIYEEKPAYGTGKHAVDFLIPAIIALTIFQGAVMGMGRAVAGEKREGSLTRVFLTPTSNATIILGTLLFYVIFELFRSTFLILFAVTLFHVKIEGSLLAIGFILIIYAGVSTGIGMILSSMVSTEQQYQGMSLLVGMPTIFLAGVFFPLEAMPRAFQILAGFLPVTYAAEALRDVMIKGFGIALILSPLFILTIFLAGTLSLLFMVFKRDIE